MAILNKLAFGTKQKSQTVPYYNIGEVGQGTFAEFLLGYSSRVNADQVMQWYRQSSAVSIPIDKIADEIEGIRPVLLMEDGTYHEDHPVLDLINKPNGYETRDEFIGQIARNYLLTHNSIVYAEGSISRPPKSLWAVKPQCVSITENSIDGYPQSYLVSTGMARGNYRRDEIKNQWIFRDSDLRQVYQICGYSSQSNNILADSPLQSVALEVRQHINGRYHNLRLLQNGARLSLIAIFRDQLDDDQLEARRQSLNAGLAGSNNAGKIAVVNSEDLDLKEVGINNKDMDFFNLDKVAQETIARRYNIPLPIISNDASTYNNMEHAVYHFYDWAVLPTYKKVYSGLSDMLLQRYGLDPAKNKITYNPDDIDAIRKRRIDELSKLKADMVITTNEYRDEISLEAVEGGDDILAPATLIPIARDVFTLDDVDDPERTAKK